MPISDCDSAAVRLLKFGETAILAEVTDLDAVVSLHRQLRASDLPEVRDLVPAARTLLITFDPTKIGHHLLSQKVLRIAQGMPSNSMPSSSTQLNSTPLKVEATSIVPVDIPVQYHGADLTQIAELTGLDEQEVIRRHSTTVYTVAFCGFAPGFAYLQGLDPQLRLPRRAEPRTRVPPGAVAIAGEWTAVYPTASPGGWHLIGHTESPVWDVTRMPPSLLEPGARVRFRVMV